MYDYLIVGAGLFGAVFAREMTDMGKKCLVIDKRDHYTRSHHNHNGHMHTHHSTTYYITFEVESGDRFELQVPEYEYGLMIVGDTGELFFQGTRFLSFTRK